MTNKKSGNLNNGYTPSNAKLIREGYSPKPSTQTTPASDAQGGHQPTSQGETTTAKPPSKR